MPIATYRRLHHPYDRGTALHRWAMLVLSLCNNNRTWRRHPEPFAKTQRGKARRNQRKFVQSFDLI
jgi:hypothetical protein